MFIQRPLIKLVAFASITDTAVVAIASIRSGIDLSHTRSPAIVAVTPARGRLTAVLTCAGL